MTFPRNSKEFHEKVAAEYLARADPVPVTFEFVVVDTMTSIYMLYGCSTWEDVAETLMAPHYRLAASRGARVLVVCFDLYSVPSGFRRFVSSCRSEARELRNASHEAVEPEPSVSCASEDYQTPPRNLPDYLFLSQWKTEVFLPRMASLILENHRRRGDKDLTLIVRGGTSEEGIRALPPDAPYSPLLSHGTVLGLHPTTQEIIEVTFFDTRCCPGAPEADFASISMAGCLWEHRDAFWTWHGDLRVPQPPPTGDQPDDQEEEEPGHKPAEDPPGEQKEEPEKVSVLCVSVDGDIHAAGIMYAAGRPQGLGLHLWHMKMGDTVDQGMMIYRASAFAAFLTTKFGSPHNYVLCLLAGGSDYTTPINNITPERLARGLPRLIAAPTASESLWARGSFFATLHTPLHHLRQTYPLVTLEAGELPSLNHLGFVRLCLEVSKTRVGGCQCPEGIRMRCAHRHRGKGSIRGFITLHELLLLSFCLENTLRYFYSEASAERPRASLTPETLGYLFHPTKGTIHYGIARPIAGTRELAAITPREEEEGPSQ
jgi:hypothetical protein